MPRPAHSRLTFTGVFGPISAPLDIWQFNLNTPSDGTIDAFTDLQMDGLAQGMATAYANGINSRMPSDVHLTECRFAAVGADGNVKTRPDGSYVQGIVTPNISGSGGTPLGLPLQTALVISLNTARSGATGKGRFYLPFPRKAIDPGDKRLTEADAQDMATGAATFLNSVNGIGEDVAVVSSYGYSSRVTSVRVGRVPDTMRSRRSKAIEGYVTAPLA